MASDIKIEVIENVLQATSEENVIEVNTKTSVVEVHNADGLNGITPHIGENGNWWIGTTDTGVHAQGEKGEQGENGLTPYIGANGNWWIGETDTQIQAQGVQGIQGIQGEKGKDGKDGADGKSAYDYAVEGGFVGTEQEFTDALNNLNEIKSIMPLVYAGL
jgi:hypothetical protein